MKDTTRLKIIGEELERSGHTWWVDHGTLLGLVRERRLFPWDKDIDLSALECDCRRLYKRLHRRRADLDASVLRTGRNIKILPHGRRSRVIDVSSYVPRRDGTLEKKLVQKPRVEGIALKGLRQRVWSSLRAREKRARQFEKRLMRRHGWLSRLGISVVARGLNFLTWMREWTGMSHTSTVPAHFFAELAPVTWKGVELWMPRSPEPYLEYRYGPDWQIPNRTWKWYEADHTVSGVDPPDDSRTVSEVGLGADGVEAAATGDGSICIATTSTFPTPGGVEIRINRYLAYFVKEGMDVHVVAGTPTLQRARSAEEIEGISELPLGSVAWAEANSGVPLRRIVLPIEINKNRFEIFNDAILTMLDRGEIDPSVFSFISTKPHFLIPLLKELRRRGKRLIYNYSIAHQSSGSRERQAKNEIRWRKALDCFDCVIVASETLRDHVRASGTRTPIEVVPNGVDIEAFKPVATMEEKVRLRRGLGLPERATIMLGMGPVYPRKGPDIFLDAWRDLAARHGNLHAVWIGRRRDRIDPAHAEFAKRIDATLETEPAPDRVHMLEHLDSAEEVSNYFRAADIFVFPSEREGMPNAVLEAMASGIPVVMTRFLGYSSLLGQHDREHIVVDRDVQSVVQALEDLFREPERSAEIAGNGRSFIADSMPVSKSVEDQLEIYRRLGAVAREISEGSSAAGGGHDGDEDPATRRNEGVA